MYNCAVRSEIMQLALSQRSHVPSGTTAFAAINASPAVIALATADLASLTMAVWVSLIVLASAGRSTGRRTSCCLAGASVFITHTPCNAIVVHYNNVVR